MEALGDRTPLLDSQPSVFQRLRRCVGDGVLGMSLLISIGVPIYYYGDVLAAALAEPAADGAATCPDGMLVAISSSDMSSAKPEIAMYQ